MVGTIHSVKGGQADVVYLFPDLSPAGAAQYARCGAARESVIRQVYLCQRETGIHYEFKLDRRRHRGSTGTADRDEAAREESRQRERLEKSYSQVIEEEAREQRRKTIQEAADAFLVEYTVSFRQACVTAANPPC